MSGFVTEHRSQCGVDDSKLHSLTAYPGLAKALLHCVRTGCRESQAVLQAVLCPWKQHKQGAAALSSMSLLTAFMTWLFSEQ